MILVSLENVTKYAHVVARLSQRLKSTLFEIFLHSGYPLGTLSSKKFQTTLILACFEANSALSRKKKDQNCENHTVLCHVITIFLNRYNLKAKTIKGYRKIIGGHLFGIRQIELTGNCCAAIYKKYRFLGKIQFLPLGFENAPNFSKIRSFKFGYCNDL